jgi:hypothetical protein
MLTRCCYFERPSLTSYRAARPRTQASILLPSGSSTNAPYIRLLRSRPRRAMVPPASDQRCTIECIDYAFAWRDERDVALVQARPRTFHPVGRPVGPDPQIRDRLREDTHRSRRTKLRRAQCIRTIPDVLYASVQIRPSGACGCIRAGALIVLNDLATL